MDIILQDEEIIDGKIYKITNLVNGKIYIGQTIRSIEERFKSHYSLNKKYRHAIHHAIDKYGISNFIIEQIDSATTKTELNQKEYEWIVKENCISPNGYNLKSGGAQPGISDETRLKQSESHKGHIHTEEQKIKIGIKSKGHVVSEDARMKISNKLMGHTVSTETRLKMSGPRKPTIQKEKQTPKTNQSELHKGGYKHSSESKLKMSESRKKLKYYYNKYTDIVIRIDISITDIPEGFVSGNRPMSEKSKEKLKNRKRCHNLISGKKFFILANDLLPENCEYGWDVKQIVE